MFTLLNELHFWTFKSEIAIRDTDFGSFCYYEKRSQLDYEFLLGKKSYCEQRGIVWCPSNKRPSKLRDSIRELEGYLETSRVIYCQWKEPDCLLIILNSGLLISVKINILTGDLEHVHFDKHLLSKLSSEHVCDVAVGGSEAVFGLSGGKVLAVHYAKSALKSSCKQWVTVDSRSSDLVPTSNQQPGLFRLRISSNSTSDKLAVWWAKEGETWLHTSTSSNFPPIHIYHFSNLRPEPACCLRTEAQPVLVVFSQFRPCILHIIVQIISPRGEVWLGWCQMDISTLRGDRGVTVQPHRTVPLHSHAATVSLSPAEDKLLIACIDSTLIVTDYSYDCVVTNRTSFGGVTLVAWHPDSCILVAGDDKARIQFFDSSLSPIQAQFSTDQHSPSLLLDIGTYFRRQPTLLNISWNKKPTSCNSTIQIDAFLFLHFERGPLGVLKLVGGSRPGFPVDSIVCHYLAGADVDRAVSLLSTLSWDFAGSVALACLQSIVKYLLIRPLTPERHGLLDKAIGSYFDSKRSISRVTCMEFNDSVTDIRRKIFHHLLRYQVYESAFKLAVELSHYDLLMDLHNQAKASGSQQMASAALEKAEQISEYSTTHSRSSVSSHSSYESSCSWCSRSSCSQCQDEQQEQKTSKKNSKDDKKISKDKEKCNGTVKCSETKSIQEDSSSQASSKTSLLHHTWEEGKDEKEKINYSSSCNIGQYKKNPLFEMTSNVQIESPNNSSQGYSESDIKTSQGCSGNEKDETEFKEHLNKIHQAFDNCVKINILDDGDEMKINQFNCENNNEQKGIENEMYVDENGDMNGRFSAEYDRDCLNDFESDSHFRTNGEVCTGEKVKDPQMDIHTYANNNQWTLINGNSNFNGTNPFVENGSGKQDLQNYHLTEGTSQVHSSSLWGKDRVHVQNVVGEQWSGSPVRVAIDKWSNLASGRESVKVLSTSRGLYNEGSEPRVNNERSSVPQKPWLINAPQWRKDCQTDNVVKDRWANNSATGNMCDLQKQLFEAKKLNDRVPDPNPSTIYNNVMEPNYARDTSPQWGTSIDYKWNGPLPPPPPLPRNTQFEWTEPYDETDGLYEQMNPTTSGSAINNWNRPPITSDSSNHWTNYTPSSGTGVNGHWTNSSVTQNSVPELPPSRVGPNLWTGTSADIRAGIFWPKPYLGPRERPPPPPPPRARVQFSDNVTHITLPQKNEIYTPVEGNFNTVGLPDAEMPGYPSQRRLNPAGKTLDSTSYSTQVSNQGSSSGKQEEGSKVKVVHFGVV